MSELITNIKYFILTIFVIWTFITLIILVLKGDPMSFVRDSLLGVAIVYIIIGIAFIITKNLEE